MSLTSAFQRQIKTQKQKPIASASAPTGVATPNTCTGIIPLNWLTTGDELEKCNVGNIKRYCTVDANLEYEIKEIDGGKQFNLFMKTCVGEIIHLT